MMYDFFQVSAAAGTFLRKVARLAAGRIEVLCDKLELSELVANEIWTVVLHVLEMNLALMRDQHLDRIILCALYGVCKVCCALLPWLLGLLAARSIVDFR